MNEPLVSVEMTESQAKTVKDWLNRVKEGRDAGLLHAVILPRLTKEYYIAAFVVDHWVILKTDSLQVEQE